MLTASSKSIVKKQVQQTAKAVLNLLFPPRCAGCGQIGTLICSNCVSTLEPLGDSVCIRCASPLTTRGLCERCKDDMPPYQRVSSGYRYVGVARDLVHAYKYERQKGLAPILANLVAKEARISNSDFALCAVPLHADRENMRGFNQAQMLAAALAEIWACDLIEQGVLVRVRATDSQVSHGNFAARQANMEGAFRANSIQAQRRRIVIVDDVCTTGATIRSCAVALLEAGAESVEGLTFARAG